MKVFSQLKENIKHFDIFGCQPEFFIDNDTKYKTKFGAFLSFLLLSSVISGCFIYGKDMYYKENPNYIQTEESTDLPEYFKINKNTLNFAFGLQNSQWTHFIDETVYNVTYQQYIMNQKTNENGETETITEIIDLKARICNENDFGVKKEYFTSLTWLSQLYCIDNYDETYMEGDYGAEKFGAIQGQVRPCRNGTDIICKPEEEIQSILNDNYWALYVSDNVINPKNYQSPFEMVGRNVYGFSSSNMYRQIDFNFRNIFIDDNTGIIFDNWHYKRGIQYSNSVELIKTDSLQDGQFLQFLIRLEKVKQTRLYRTYLNIAEVAANVGGILKVLTMMFAFIAAKYAQLYMNINIVNSIFNFEDDSNDKQDGKQKEHQKKQKSENNIQKQNNQQNQELNEKDSNLKQRVKKLIIDVIQKQNKKFKLGSFLSFINPFNCKKKEQQKDLNEKLHFSVQKIGYHLNIKNILHKIVEIDKLKMLLLDEDQMNLFEYMPKPLITKQLISKNKQTTQSSESDLDQFANDDNFSAKRRELAQKKSSQNKSFNFLDEDKRNDQQVFLDAYLAYKQIMLKKKRQKIDDRILQTMDHQLKEQFDYFFQIGQQQSNIDSKSIAMSNINSFRYRTGKREFSQYNQPVQFVQPTEQHINRKGSISPFSINNQSPYIQDKQDTQIQNVSHLDEPEPSFLYSNNESYMDQYKLESAKRNSNKILYPSPSNEIFNKDKSQSIYKKNQLRQSYQLKKYYENGKLMKSQYQRGNKSKNNSSENSNEISNYNSIKNNNEKSDDSKNDHQIFILGNFNEEQINIQVNEKNNLNVSNVSNLESDLDNSQVQFKNSNQIVLPFSKKPNQLISQQLYQNESVSQIKESIDCSIKDDICNQQA